MACLTPLPAHARAVRCRRRPENALQAPLLQRLSLSDAPSAAEEAPAGPDPERCTGHVKWFNSTKGKGAVRGGRGRVAPPHVPPPRRRRALAGSHPLAAGYGFITSEECEDEVFVHQVGLERQLWCAGSSWCACMAAAAQAAPGRGGEAAVADPTSLPTAPLQSNIETTGYRSLKEGEEVEFDLVVAEDGKKKAFRVTGPGGAPPQVGMAGRRQLQLQAGPQRCLLHQKCCVKLLHTCRGNRASVAHDWNCWCLHCGRR